MSRYRKIDTRIWNDKKFNELSDDGKFVLFLFLSHPHLTPLGAMRATIAGLASELRWDIDRFKKSLDECAAKNIVIYDDKAAFFRLCNFIKYNQPESPNVVRSWDQYLDYLPECGLKDDLIEGVESYITNRTDAFKEALPEVFVKAMPNQEQEQEHKQEQEKKKERAPGNPDVSSLKNLIITGNKKSLSQNTKQHCYQSDATEVLNFLNFKANKAFEPNRENLKWITERLRDGETVDTCRQVIVRKTNDWIESIKMKSQLNPFTLFKKDNFSRYKGELVMPDEELVEDDK